MINLLRSAVLSIINEIRMTYSTYDLTLKRVLQFHNASKNLLIKDDAKGTVIIRPVKLYNKQYFRSGHLCYLLNNTKSKEKKQKVES